VVNSILGHITSLHHHWIEHGLGLALLAIVVLVTVISIVVVIIAPSVKWKSIVAIWDEFASWWVCAHFLFLFFLLKALLPVEHHLFFELFHGQLACVLLYLFRFNWSLFDWICCWCWLWHLKLGSRG